MYSYNVFWTSELNCGEVGLLYLTFCMRSGTALAYPLDGGSPKAENEVPCATSLPLYMFQCIDQYEGLASTLVYWSIL
jgi:hypothetical protein